MKSKFTAGILGNKASTTSWDPGSYLAKLPSTDVVHRSLCHTVASQAHRPGSSQAQRRRQRISWPHVGPLLPAGKLHFFSTLPLLLHLHHHHRRQRAPSPPTFLTRVCERQFKKVSEVLRIVSSASGMTVNDISRISVSLQLLKSSLRPVLMFLPQRNILWSSTPYLGP